MASLETNQKTNHNHAVGQMSLDAEMGNMKCYLIATEWIRKNALLCWILIVLLFCF